MLNPRTCGRRLVWVLPPVALAFVLASGCATERTSTPSPQAAEQPAAAVEPAGAVAETVSEAPIIRRDRIYAIDDVAAAGFKKSKQYPTETLPHATAAWYGFFNQKDIEVWVYPTHEEALEFGVPPAEDATGRAWRKGGGEKGAGTKAMFTYGGYMVVGNLVILCELEVANCEALVANME
ncbi:MAG: hypothetical protein FJ313_03545 [Gemmatimonadetes bacterium]|nr:hypothetical protein [Gemmatimonadota bacterium]